MKRNIWAFETVGETEKKKKAALCSFWMDWSCFLAVLHMETNTSVGTLRCKELQNLTICTFHKSTEKKSEEFKQVKSNILSEFTGSNVSHKSPDKAMFTAMLNPQFSNKDLYIQ